MRRQENALPITIPVLDPVPPFLPPDRYGGPQWSSTASKQSEQMAQMLAWFSRLLPRKYAPLAEKVKVA